MQPRLTEKERQVLVALGKKDPNDLDRFEQHVKAEIGRLSMGIDNLRTRTDNLKNELSQAEETLQQSLGAFEATARTYLVYLQSTPKLIAEWPEDTQPMHDTEVDQDQSENESEFHGAIPTKSQTEKGI